METDNRVTNLKSVHWPPCQSAEVNGERLVCVLDWEHKYDLTGTYSTSAYPERPHLDFLNVENDGDLAAFVRRWGPL